MQVSGKSLLSLNFSAGDVLEVAFPFEETEGEKRRPVLFWAIERDYVIVSKITSRLRKRTWDVDIQPDGYNGLTVPSAVQIDKTAKLHISKIADLIPKGSINKIQLGIIHKKLQEFAKTRE